MKMIWTLADLDERVMKYGRCAACTDKPLPGKHLCLACIASYPVSHDLALWAQSRVGPWDLELIQERNKVGRCASCDGKWSLRLGGPLNGLGGFPLLHFCVPCYKQSKWSPDIVTWARDHYRGVPETPATVLPSSPALKRNALGWLVCACGTEAEYAEPDASGGFTCGGCRTIKGWA